MQIIILDKKEFEKRFIQSRFEVFTYGQGSGQICNTNCNGSDLDENLHTGRGLADGDGNTHFGSGLAPGYLSIDNN